MWGRICHLGLLMNVLVGGGHAVERDLVVPTNAVVRVMAANLTGAPQKYEPFAIRLFQGLRPDVVAIQEFNYSNNTPAQIRAFIDTTFGTNFTYFRETNSGYDLPNGIVSRYPIKAAGSWDDPEIPNRGFAWAQLDLPGPNDLHVVSVHFKSSGGDADRRANEATALKQAITTNLTSNAWVVVGGDLNLENRNEVALTTLKTILSDSPIPADQAGDPDTNAGRDNPYDLVLPGLLFATNLTPLVLGSQTFNNGLVFDSRVYSPLAEVAPVQSGDSGLAQHMAVLKDFRIRFNVTNRVEVPQPVLTLARSNATLRWPAVPGITYMVERSTTLTNWLVATQFTASTTNLIWSNAIPTNAFRFYRVSF